MKICHIKCIAYIVLCPLLGIGAHGASKTQADTPAPIYASYGAYVLFPALGMEIEKKAGILNLQSILEIGDGPDVMLRYENAEYGLTATITFYRAPNNTQGPHLIIDGNGNPRLSASNDNPYAIFDLTEPSESYSDEFWKVVGDIENNFSLKMMNRGNYPARYKAVPDIDSPPIAYVAFFSGTGAFKGAEAKDIAWAWDFKLFYHNGYFIKIHTEGPDMGDYQIAAQSLEIMKAVNWTKALAENRI